MIGHYPDRFRVSAISSNENIKLLSEQIEEFNPDSAVIGNKDLYTDLKNSVGENTGVMAGKEALKHLAGESPADIVFIAVSGTAALEPLIAALSTGRTVALASKEPVVSAGSIIKKLAKENSSRILPVDSEHSAIMQCMAGRENSDIRTLYITGSGGSLSNKDLRFHAPENKHLDFGMCLLLLAFQG